MIIGLIQQLYNQFLFNKSLDTGSFFYTVNSSLIVTALQNKVPDEFNSLASISSCQDIASAVTNSNLNKELEMNNAVIIAPKTNYTTTSNGVIIFSAMDTSTAIESQSSVYMQIDGNNYNEFKSSKSSSGYYQGVMIKNVNKNSVIYCSNTGLEGYIIVFIPFS